MSPPERKRATSGDLEALPENVVGERSASPRQGNPRGIVITHLLACLAPFAESSGNLGGWWFLYAPEWHFGDDVLVPDLAGWRGPELPDQNRPFATVAPDWICEVLTPSTSKIDRTLKLPVYAHGKVGHAWLLDPKARTLEVLRRSGQGWSPAGSFSADARIRAEPFDAVELDLASLWP